MANKKIQRKITVKSPAIGETYYFRFAGSILKGTLISEAESLSKHYNEKYYMLLSNEIEVNEGSATKYPVSIREIALTRNELRNV